MHTAKVRCLNATGFHEMTYHEWGSADNDRVLVCVHGLARNSRDFDDLAKVLAREYRVICPDVVGRGESDWLPAGQGYAVPQYISDMTNLLARLGVDKVDWVGTSMGGIIGICLAAMSNSPIKNLVLNDVGAFIPYQCLQRIAQYLGAKKFSTLADAELYLKSVYPALGSITAAQWQHITKHSLRENEQGELMLHYDPAIADATRANADKDVDLWPVWSQIDIPQLLIWGETSDVLQAETVQQMQNNDKLELYTIAGTGHAPSLMEPDQIQHIQNWLRANR